MDIHQSKKLVTNDHATQHRTVLYTVNNITFIAFRPLASKETRVKVSKRTQTRVL